MRGWIALALLFALTACPSVYAYEYRVGYAADDTPEGRACTRECLSIIGVCSNTLARAGGEVVPIYPVAGPHSAEHGCTGIMSDCMATCPGARQVDGGPRLVELWSDGWTPEDDYVSDGEEEVASE